MENINSKNKVELSGIKFMLLDDREFVPVCINEDKTGLVSPVSGETIFEYKDFFGHNKSLPFLTSTMYPNNDNAYLLNCLQETFMAKNITFHEIDYLKKYLDCVPGYLKPFNSISRTLEYGDYQDICDLKYSTISVDNLSRFVSIINVGAINRLKKDMQAQLNSKEFFQSELNSDTYNEIVKKGNFSHFAMKEFDIKGK